jgi:pSer/pThr/pTyr-binding forkhead associated (FHA) protein
MVFLSVTAGRARKQRLDIEKDDVSIGRASDNDLVIEDSSVSGHHCAVLRDGRKYTLRDLDSTNGTRLNGLPVRESRLKPGDVVTVGEADIQFDGDDVEVVQSPSPQAAAHAAGAPPTVRTTSTGQSTVFQAKKDTRTVWLAVLTFVVLLALGALGWFLFTLFKS